MIKFNKTWLLRFFIFQTLIYICDSLHSQTISTKKDTITVMGDVSFPPFEYFDFTKNKAEGIYVDLWQRIGQLSDVVVIYKCDNWAKAQQMVFDGKADALSTADKTDQRLKYLYYVGKPLHTLYIYVYYHKKLTAFKDLNSLSKGIKVGVVKGDISEAYIQKNYPDVSIEEFDNYEVLIHSALSDSLFVFVMEPPIAQHHFIENKKLESSFIQSNDALLKEDLYCAIRKDKPRLIAKIANGINMLSEREKKAVFKKWNYDLEGPTLFDWYQNSPTWLKYILNLILFYLLILFSWWMLYILKPNWLVTIRDTIKKTSSFELSVKWFSFKFSLTKVLLIDLFVFSIKIADTWVNKNRGQVEINIKKITTFKERIIFTPTPLQVDQTILDNSDAAQLIAEIKEQIKQAISSNQLLIILGEGGGGKTSLAINIARWTLGSPEFLGFSAIPIFIETDLDINNIPKEYTQNAFFFFIKTNLQILLKKEGEGISEIDDEFFKFLIFKKRILLIVDGLSELTETTRHHLIQYFASVGVNSSIVTSRPSDFVPKFSLTQTTISPLRLSGIYLSLFMENILTLKKLRSEYTDIEFYIACRYLAGISGKRSVTILFAVLFIDVLINQKKTQNIPIGARSIAELVQKYIVNLTDKYNFDKYRNDETIGLLKLIAWNIVGVKLIPQPINKTLLKSQLNSVEDLDDKLDYLIYKINVINEFDPIVPKYRFSLDPISEYLAAIYVIDNLLNGNLIPINQVQDFITSNDLSLDQFMSNNEFLQAYCDCCLSLDESDFKIIQTNTFSNAILEVYKANIKKTIITHKSQ